MGILKADLKAISGQIAINQKRRRQKTSESSPTDSNSLFVLAPYQLNIKQIAAPDPYNVYPEAYKPAGNILFTKKTSANSKFTVGFLRDLSMLCRFSYKFEEALKNNKKDKKTQKNKLPKPPDGWEIQTLAGKKLHRNGETGYAGIAFRHKETQQLVVVHQGTNEFADWTKQNLGTPFGEGAQIQDALDFTRLVKKQNPNERIVFVGHSLGGGLAQVSMADSLDRDKKTQDIAITFNAPGAWTVVKRHFPQLKEKIYNKYIYNYANRDILPKILPPIGNLVYVGKTTSAQAEDKNLFSTIFKDHGINNFVSSNFEEKIYLTEYTKSGYWHVYRITFETADQAIKSRDALIEGLQEAYANSEEFNVELQNVKQKVGRTLTDEGFMNLFWRR